MGRTPKHSWVMRTSKGTWLGLVRCPKYSIRSGKGGDFEEEKRVSKGQSYISVESSFASTFNGKPAFSEELNKTKHCICVQRASLRKDSRHRLHSKWPK